MAVNPLREQLAKKYGASAPATTTAPAAGARPGAPVPASTASASSASGNALRDRLAQKYTVTQQPVVQPGAPAYQAPAPTTTQPRSASLFNSLDLAFPQTQTTTASTTKTGTFEMIKNVTSAILSIPKAIIDGQMNPDNFQQEFEAMAYPKTGNVITDTVTAPARAAGKVITRFLNPGFRPFGETVASAIIGNNPDSFDYDPMNIQYLPGVQKKSSQVVGEVAQAVLTAYSPSVLGRSAVATAGGPVKTALLTGARTGGEAGAFFGFAQVAAQDIRDPKDIATVMFMNIAGGAAIGAITSGAIPAAREGVQALTKDIIEQYNLPPSVYIDARKVKDIFQTGNVISPDESAMVRSLGLNGSQYRQAFREGVYIQVPAEKIITITDKPWFAKVKSAIGIAPANPNVRVVTYPQGVQSRADRLLDDGGRQTPPDMTPDGVESRIRASEGMDVDAAIARGDIPAATVYADPAKKTFTPEYAQGRVDDVANKLNAYWPGLGDTYRTNTPLTNLTMDAIEDAGVRALDMALAPGRQMLALPAGQATAVSRAFNAPIRAGMLAKLSQFTQDQQAAFGRNVIQTLNEELGTNVTPGELTIPENIRVIDQPSVDGRPAQYNGQDDRIEIFLPNLMNDLKALVGGRAILIHPDSPYTEVVRLEEGESIKDLVSRYVKEIVLHEAAHQKTPTSLQDQQELQQINAEITQARLNQDQNAINAAETKKDAKIMAVENAANEYLKANRVALEKEIFAKRGIDGDYKFEIEDTGTGVRAVYTDGPSAGAPVEGMQAATRPALLKQIIVANREGRVSLDMNQYASEVVALKAPNKFERRALKIPDESTVTMTEKDALNARQKARAQGSREGYVAGKREAAEKTKTELVSRFDKAMAKVKDRNASIAAKRADLIDYAQLLAYKDRGRFLKAINNTKTDKEFGEVLERMRKAAATTDRAALIKEILSELKSTAVKKRDGVPNAKFAYEQQKTLNEIRAAQRIFETRAKELRAGGQKEASAYALAQMEIADKISAWQTKNPDGVFPADMLHEVEVLKMVGLKDMTARELRAALAAIKSIKEEGRTVKELERFNRDTEVQRIKETVIETVTGGKPLPSEELSIKRRGENKKEFFKEYARTSIFAWEELLDKLSREDKGSKTYESFLSRFGQENSNRAFNAQNRGELAAINKVQEIMNQAYGVDTKGSTLKLIGDLQTRVDLGEIIHNDGKKRKVELTREEAIQYHMWHQDEALDSTFEETLHWGPEVWEKIDGMLTKEDRQAADGLLEFYREYYGPINEVFSADYGIDLPFNENYSPVHRAIDVTIPENVLLAQESAKYATAKNGSLKERVKNNIDLKPTGALENVIRHISKMEHYKAWSDPMYKFRRVFGDAQFRQAVADFHGEPYLKILDNTLNDFARDGVAREKINVLADTLRKNATKAILGLNIPTAIKQVPGVLNYGIELPTKDFFAGLTGFWGNPMQNARFLYDNSDTLQERFGAGFERDIAYTIEQGYDKKLAGAQNLSEVLFIPMRNADKLTVYMGGWAAFQSKFKQLTGKPFRFNEEVDEAAVKKSIEYMEDVTNRVQESSRLDTLAPLQRDGSWLKLLTMFQSQPSKYIRIMVNAGRNYKAGRESGPRALKRIAWAWLIAPFVWNFVNDMFKDEDYREGPAGVALRTLMGPLTYPLIVGQIAQTAYGWTQGQGFDYKPSPAFAFADDIVKATQNFAAEDVVDGTTYMIDAIGKLSGVPTTLLTRPIRKGKKEAEDEGGGGSAVSF